MIRLPESFTFKTKASSLYPGYWALDPYPFYKDSYMLCWVTEKHGDFVSRFLTHFEAVKEGLL